MDWTWYSFEELNTYQLYSILALRQEVFILEQQCFYYDIDNQDQHAMHLLGMESGQLIAYLRLLPKGIVHPNEASFGRFIITREHRGLGLGKLMMERMLTYFEEHFAPSPMLIMAQLYLQSFYEGFGFQKTGKEFDDNGIMHINMRRP